MTTIPTIVFDSNACISELCELGRQAGTDKSPLNEGKFRHAYTPIYNFLFAPLKYKRINLAEIGIAKGKGLLMFRQYFPNANLYGLDIHERFISESKNLSLANTRFALTDAADREQLRQSFEGFHCLFDIIIDDGSHKLEQQINAIHACFALLNIGGIMVIEDISCEEEEIIEQTFVEALNEYKSEVSFVSFVLPRNERTFTGTWNNEKLLIITKGLKR